MKNHSKGALPYECQECGKSFADPQSLRIHNYVHYPELKPARKKPRNLETYECIECVKTYKEKRSLEIHIDMIHKGIKRHKCEYCAKEFGRRWGLQAHLMIHTGEMPFKCEYCGLGFRDKRYMVKHIDKSHG